ncbi:hypothetical protein ACU7M0_37460, partial [Burkholderia cenocepacia]
VPLPAYTGAARGASVPAHAGSAPSDAAARGTPAEQVAALDPNAFFTRFARALQHNPAPADAAAAPEAAALPEELQDDTASLGRGLPAEHDADRLAQLRAVIAPGRPRNHRLRALSLPARPFAPAAHPQGDPPGHLYHYTPAATTSPSPVYEPPLVHP